MDSSQEKNPKDQKARVIEPAAKATPAYVNIDLKTEERDKLDWVEANDRVGLPGAFVE